MNNSPAVTVIMPVYNAEKYIKAAVNSVVNQTYSNWELIIVNDGSSDGTEDYLRTLHHSSIKVFHQKNKGVSSARNKALIMASGEYITFMDADDMLTANSLEVRAKYLFTNPSVDIVDGVLSYRDKNLDEELRRYVPSYRGKLFERLIRLDSRVFALPFYMIKKSVVHGCYLDEDMTHLEDLMFFLNISKKQEVQYDFVGDVVYLYRTGHVSAMSSLAGIESGYFQMLHKLNKFQGVSFGEHLFLRLKISKILFLSWFAEGSLSRGVKTALKSLFASYK